MKRKTLKTQKGATYVSKEKGEKEPKKVFSRKYKASYCNGCEFRQTDTTNLDEFCEAGYGQNPSTLKAIQNLLKNGGQVCSRARSFYNKEMDKVLFAKK